MTPLYLARTSRNIWTNVDKVMSRLRKHRLVMTPAKCQMFTETVTHLGDRVEGGEVKLLTANIVALKEYLMPRTTKLMRAFLDLVNYYRKCIPNLASTHQ